MVLTINTDCSGMEAPIQAAVNLGIKFEHLFSCDVDKHARATIDANFPPKVEMYLDITVRDHAKAPSCDLYVAGFPCQPFSSAGLQQGFSDQRGRGKIFFDVLNYIKKQQPKVFILENVSGLVRIEGGSYFNAILQELECIGIGKGSGKKYNVQHQILDTKHHGVPHSRRRIYIVGIREDADKGTFQFPSKIPMPSIEEFLDPRDAKLAKAGMPPVSQGTAFKNVRTALAKLKADGKDPHKEAWIVDIDSSAPRSKSVFNCAPCITCSRRSGHWVTNRGRRLNLAEMLRLQGMRPDTFIQAVSNAQLGKQIGNAMSVNVLERLLVQLLPAAGLCPASKLTDRWANGTALRQLRWQAGRGGIIMGIPTTVAANPSKRKAATAEESAPSPPAKRVRCAGA